MTPAQIALIAGLLGEALNAGASLSALLKEAKATGHLSPETWARIDAEVTSAEAGWDAA
jgi:hypothetical protein